MNGAGGVAAGGAGIGGKRERGASKAESSLGAVLEQQDQSSRQANKLGMELK